MKKLATSTKSSIELCNESLIAIQSLYFSRSQLHRLIAESRDMPPYEAALMFEADDGEGIIEKATESIEKLKEAGEALKKELKEFSDKLPDFFENTKATLEVVSKEIDTMLPGDSFFSKISSGISSMTRALFGSQNSPIAKVSKMAYDLNALKAMIAAATKSVVDGVQKGQADSLKDPEVKKEFDSKKSELMTTPVSQFKKEDIEKFGLPTPESLTKLIEPALKPPDGMFAGFKKLSKSLGFDVGGKMPFDKYLSKEEFVEDFMNSTPEELASISGSAPKGPVKPSAGTQQVGAALQQVQQVQTDSADAEDEGAQEADAQKNSVMDVLKGVKVKGLDLEKHAELLSGIIVGEDDKKAVKKESYQSPLGNLLFESEDIDWIFEAPEESALENKEVRVEDYSGLRLLSQLVTLAYNDDPKTSLKMLKKLFGKKKTKFRARDAYDLIVKAVAKKLGAKPKEKGLKAIPNAFGKSAKPGDYALWGYEGVEAKDAEKLAKTKLPDETYGAIVGGAVAKKGKEIKFFMTSKYKTYNKATLAAEKWLSGEELEEPEDEESAEGKEGKEGQEGEESEAEGKDEKGSESGEKGSLSEDPDIQKAGERKAPALAKEKLKPGQYSKYATGYVAVTKKGEKISATIYPDRDFKDKEGGAEGAAKKKALTTEAALFERWSILAGIS